MSIRLRSMTPDDWSSVAEIYRQGIATDDATFERKVPTWDTCRLKPFRVVGTRNRIAQFYDGRWRDTVFMGRRSDVCGLDWAAGA
ncbi:MAG: hypothetical protein HN396_14135 [Gemmatimonadales bacterium]|jgi:L-amino acid N-acyltransferase YncA|nr:hypothetical protein [Gemmatimonadales bacterium]MBT3497237.1 hypothetical protein [Gemmatimonadales bacterium]MBT3775285.1 hypothetical protein [Gemmatimonadales bacterium]MBT3957425.1 hypothetical protein [Gemmatimonadales bacterium]MBT4436498.1 hypothetical protein [Gemmatimonadales bacterium]